MTEARATAGAGRLLEADIVVRHEGCAVSESLTDGAFAAQVSSDRNADVLVMTGPSPAHVERFVQALRATQAREPEVVTRTDDSVVVRGRNPEWGVVATINRSGCATLWPSVWHDGLERYTVLAASRAQLDALLRELDRLGGAELTRVSEVTPRSLGVHVSLASLTDGFTQRQLGALRLAVEEGYYDSPRRTDSETLAARTGKSRTTFEEHLRKAERRALERFAAAVAAHDVLQEPSGRPGRPPARTRTTR